MIRELWQTGRISPRAERWLAVLFIAFHAVMAVSFSLGPIFEGQDEFAHYIYARYLKTERQLPTYVIPGKIGSYEYHQPPLYYLLGSLILFPFDDADFETILASANTYRSATTLVDGWGSIPIEGNDNKNAYLHGPNEAFPFTASGTALAAHVLRLFSVALGVLTVTTAYAIYQLLWPDDPACRLLALGITCAWPSFQYMSSIVTNDILAAALVTLCTYLCLRMVWRGPSWSGAALIGLVFGAAMITKANGPLLAAPIGVGFLVSGRRSWHYALATVAVAATVAGWWYARATMLYGEPLALTAQYALVPSLKPPAGYLSLAELGGRWVKTYQMIWARFGLAANIGVPTSVGMIYDAITMIGVTGATTVAATWLNKHTARSWSSPRFQLWAVQGSLGAAWIMGATAFNMINTYGFEGRHMLPGISVWASALAIGLMWWLTSERARARLVVTLPGLMAVLAILSLEIVYSAYRLSPLPARIEFPRALIFENTIELIGVDQNTIAAQEGGSIQFTLYWKALKSTQRTVIVDVLTNHVNVFEVKSYPGTGNWPSSQWAAGQTWAEHYQVTLGSQGHLGSVLPVVIRLMDRDTNKALPITTPQANSIYLPTIMYLSIAP